jgi:hypothetical protein
LWFAGKEKKGVQFNEQVQVKSIEPLPDEIEINEVSAHGNFRFHSMRSCKFKKKEERIKV